MLAIPRRIKGVTHPLINEMYMKKEIAAENDIRNILVITTRKGQKGVAVNEITTKLLNDLQGLKDKIEQKAGAFDRIDIKSA